MFLERFIQYIRHEKRYSAHTVSAYQSRSGAIYALFKPTRATRQVAPPSEISHHDIRNWMVQLMDNKLLARSVNRKIATLRKYFKFLLQEGVITANPTSRITAPKVPKNLPTVVDSDKLTDMLDGKMDSADDKISPMILPACAISWLLRCFLAPACALPKLPA
jgi:integrase/recombinase XerC